MENTVTETIENLLNTKSYKYGELINYFHYILTDEISKSYEPKNNKTKNPEAIADLKNGISLIGKRYRELYVKTDFKSLGEITFVSSITVAFNLINQAGFGEYFLLDLTENNSKYIFYFLATRLTDIYECLLNDLNSNVIYNEDSEEYKEYKKASIKTREIIKKNFIKSIIKKYGKEFFVDFLIDLLQCREYSIKKYAEYNGITRNSSNPMHEKIKVDDLCKFIIKNLPKNSDYNFFRTYFEIN